MSATVAAVGLVGICRVGMPIAEQGKVGNPSCEFSQGRMMRSVELFTGAGGLALGTHQAGFRPLAMVEWNGDAVATLQENKRRGIKAVNCPIFKEDVGKFDFSFIKDPVDLCAGGPPCQPFSIGGKHAGHKDERNMFPAFFRAVNKLKPKAVLIENVRGLSRQSFANYYLYIQRQLTYPEVTREKGERWMEHLGRLNRLYTSSAKCGLEYRVVPQVVNAAEYGVPQQRHRVFIVGLREDLNLEWSFPNDTHSLDALLHTQFITGEYWDRHKIASKHRPKLSERLKGRVDKLRALSPKKKAMRTVRDAIIDLPKPRACRDVAHISEHEYNPGARTYAGHTGSPLDVPAKALKAGDHGVPGGENMLALPSGKVRYFSVRESARLQTFPDDYIFTGSWTEIMRQLGNAVPTELARIVAGGIRDRLQQKIGVDDRHIQST